MKSCKLLKVKQSVVLWQVFSPMFISGFYSPFIESTGNHLPLYSEEKQTLLWHLRGVSRMKNQSLLLTMSSKHKCVVTQFCTSNGEPSWTLHIVCRTERDLAARKNAWQVTWKVSSFLLEAFEVHQKEFCTRTGKHKWLNHQKKPCSASSVPVEPWPLLKGNLPIRVELSTCFPLQTVWKETQSVQNANVSRTHEHTLIKPNSGVIHWCALIFVWLLPHPCDGSIPILPELCSG